MPAPSRVTLFLLTAAILTIPADSQETRTTSGNDKSPSSTFENSAGGLRRQFEGALSTSRDHNRAMLEAFVRQMEIPESDTWFAKTFGKEQGENWAEAYRQDLTANEKELAAQLVRIGDQEGDWVIRKVNDAPQAGMEAAIVSAFQRPTDIYYLGWNPHVAAGAPSRSEFIGFFVYIDGRFRWNSAVRPMKIAIAGTRRDGTMDAPGEGVFRPGTRGVGYPACSYCPDPEYTREARHNHIEGTVVLQAIITTQGTAADIKLVKSLTPDLDETAIRAVEKWRFKPARNEAHEPVSVIIPIEVTFRLVH